MSDVHSRVVNALGRRWLLLGSVDGSCEEGFLDV